MQMYRVVNQTKGGNCKAEVCGCSLPSLLCVAIKT